MNKKEYLTRVFEAQIGSLTRQIEEYEDEIEHLTGQLRQTKLNLEETKETLSFAKNEMEKLT